MYNFHCHDTISGGELKTRGHIRLSDEGLIFPLKGEVR